MLPLILENVSYTAGGRTLTSQAGWAVPRTPWGHPDLQGTYSNDDETGTPMERPADLAGKTAADLTPEEVARLVKERNDRFVAGASGAHRRRPAA